MGFRKFHYPTPVSFDELFDKNKPKKTEVSSCGWENEESDKRDIKKINSSISISFYVT